MKRVRCAVLMCGSIFGFAQQASGPIDNQRVFELARLGVSSSEMIRIIGSAPTVSFDLRPGSTDNLLKAGVSEDVIKAMSAKQNGLAPTAVTPSAPSISVLPVPVRSRLVPKTSSPPPDQIAAADGGTLLTPIQIHDAINRGSHFISRQQYLQKGLSNNRVQLASIWAKDGISKHVTFFTDQDVIAAAAAAAAQQMRVLTTPEIQQLPLSGLLYANVLVHGMGTYPAEKVVRRYSADRAHLVLEINGEVIQPVTKETVSVRDASWTAPVGLFTWYTVGHISLLTGGQIGFDGAKAEIEFAYALTPEELASKANVILIDGDGHKHRSAIDLSTLR